MPSKTRRFYSTFYQWALLASPRPCPAISPKRRLLHRSVPRLADSEAVPVVRKHQDSGGLFRKVKQPAAIETTLGEKAARPRSNAWHRTLRPAQHEKADDNAWEKAEAQSSEQKPFDMLEPWEEVVRYNTSAGVMLQMAVPSNALDMLLRQYKDMAALKRKTGATTELGQRLTKIGSDRSSVEVRALLVSGLRDEVRAFRKIVRGLKPVTRGYAKAAVSLAGAPTATKAYTTLREDTFLATTPVISYDERGTQEMESWEFLLRERFPNGEMVVQIVVPVEQWDSVSKSSAAIARMDEYYDLKCDVQPVAGRLTNVSVMLRGQSDPMHRALLRIKMRRGDLERLEKAAMKPKDVQDVEKTRKPRLKPMEAAEPTLLSADRAFKVPEQNRLLASLNDWECVVRGRTEDRMWKVEVSVPAEQWEQVLHQPRFPSIIQDIRDRYSLEYSDDTTTVSDTTGRVAVALKLEGNQAAIKRVFTAIKEELYILRTGRTLRQSNPHMWEDSPVVPEDKRSVQDLEEWECLLRDRSPSGELTVQIAVPTEQWNMVSESSPTFRAGAHHRVEVNAEKVAGDDELMSVVLQGAFEPIMHAISSLKSSREEASRKRPDLFPNLSIHGTEATSTMSPGVAEQRREDMKAALRPLTHPVVLITAKHVSPSQGMYEDATTFTHCRGVTVSSFNSVALQPKMIVSFNIKVPSRTWDAIKLSMHCCIHVLTATPSGAAIAHTFTQPYDHPHEPFERLQGAGYRVRLRNPLRTPNMPPRLADKGVSAWLLAELLEDKCVELGDHVIVVAKVRTVTLRQADSGGNEEREMGHGLAYAMRGYRGAGAGIKPAELVDANPEEPEIAIDLAGEEDVVDDTNNATTEVNTSLPANEAPAREDSTVAHEALGKNEALQAYPQMGAGAKGSAVEERHEPSTPQLNDLSSVTAESSRSNEGGLNTDNPELATEAFFEEFSRAPLDVDEPEASAVSNTSQDPGPEVVHQNVEEQQGLQQQEARQQRPERQATLDREFDVASDADVEPNVEAVNAADLPASATQPSQDTSRSGSSVRGPRRGSAGAWGVMPDSRSFSTLAVQRTRGYSTVTHGTHRPDIQSQVTDPSLLSVTVADFLGEPIGRFTRRPRMRNMMRAKRDAERASRELEKALADGSLTPEESSRLEKVVVTSERRIARKLAKSSAVDLRNMLDTGRIVDSYRVQWLESSIEKGLAVLLEEAKRLREALDQNWIPPESFHVVKAKLEEEHMLLNTEVMRLRQMVDEEGEDGGAGGPIEGQDAGKGRFDGFRGNR